MPRVLVVMEASVCAGVRAFFRCARAACRMRRWNWPKSGWRRSIRLGKRCASGTRP